MEYHPNDIFNDRYVLKELLGRGSFGEVWLSYDNVACIDVALKIYIALDNRGLEDFRNEYRSVYEIEHPNILKPMHFAVWGRQPYLVMHYCPVSSESLIGRVTEEEIWRFISDVSSGLAYLHEQNIIHRDIKPDNILRDSQGRYVLTDFGLSKRLRASLRRNSTRAHQDDVSGALSYMGPELFESKPEAVKATDIWAFGVTVYEMLMGELPFMGQGGIMLKNGADIPELPNTYSYGLRKLVHDCLQKNPWDRPTAAQLTNYKGLKKPKGDPGIPNNDSKHKLWKWLIGMSAVVFLFLCFLCCLSKSEINVMSYPTGSVIWLDNVKTDITTPGTLSLRPGKHIIRLTYNDFEDDEFIYRMPYLGSYNPNLERLLSSKNINIENGYEWEDLGLSVKWATKNVGASSINDRGYYFAWGETFSKNDYSWSTYKYRFTVKSRVYNDDRFIHRNPRKIRETDFVQSRLMDEQYAHSQDSVHYGLSKYNTTDNYGQVDNINELEPSDDAARANWGGNWRMPTKKDFEELITNCSFTPVRIGGINGYQVTSNINGKSIYLPATGYLERQSRYYEGERGYYWTSSLWSSYPERAARFVFDFNTNIHVSGYDSRSQGLAIRPVLE